MKTVGLMITGFLIMAAALAKGYDYLAGGIPLPFLASCCLATVFSFMAIFLLASSKEDNGILAAVGITYLALPVMARAAAVFLSYCGHVQLGAWLLINRFSLLWMAPLALVCLVALLCLAWVIVRWNTAWTIFLG